MSNGCSSSRMDSTAQNERSAEAKHQPLNLSEAHRSLTLRSVAGEGYVPLRQGKDREQLLLLQESGGSSPPRRFSTPLPRDGGGSPKRFPV
ncbi:unnamed protein product, partial [Nesidiocoris tenuis]